LLNTFERNAFRIKILDRDGNKCNTCSKQRGDIGIGKVHLEVHHKYYIQEKLPWDYELDALETLCNECHEEYHRNNEILVYEEINGQLFNIDANPCPRCSGSGTLSQYVHVDNGVGYRCHGVGYIIKG